ncbi:MAG TPA: hypothetical protein PLL14_03965 [Accumulibacter sp.]|nr:hypothetical protein [Accumulibacter sp.]
MRARVLLLPLSLLSALPSAAPAQDVFVTRGAGSPVFSDKPQAGAKPLSLPPLNVIEPLPVSRAPAAATPAREESRRAEPAIPAYQKFSIVSPANDGSVLANTALFEVRVVVEPPLQLGEGHAVTVSINGRPVGQRFTAGEFMIPPEFWGDTLPPANQRHQLDAAIVDRNGAVLRRAEPVTFHLRYVAGLQHRHAPRSAPMPIPVDKPRPPAQPEPLIRKFVQPARPLFEH